MSTVRSSSRPLGRTAAALCAAGGVVGPVAFVTTWALLGLATPDYSPVHDAISRLAATGASTRAWMTAGLLAFAAGMSTYALGLRAAVPGPAWVTAMATGAATVGVAAFPLGPSGAVGDATAHAAFAFAGYASLAATPLLAARGEADRGRSAWARLSLAAAALSAVFLAASTVGPLDGLFQRLGLTVGDAWVVASAVTMVRRQ